MHNRVIKPVFSESAVQEILLTQNPARRNIICKFMVDLLQEGPILAPVAHQVRWSSVDFAEGRASFRPYRTKKEDWVKNLLLNSDNISQKDFDELFKKRGNEDRSWDGMHATGRGELKKLIPKNGKVTPNEWLGLIESEFVSSLVVKIVATEAVKMVRGNERLFVEWNPMLRCYLEQFLLAIYRHAIEPPNAASKKGPKWMDYSHGAFVGLVDVFVTDDIRFFRALDQHLQLRPEWKCFIYTQTEFIRVLDSGKGFRNAFARKVIKPLPSRG
jgi:hypothetical protein